MPEPPLDPELAALSAALGGLPPAPPALDRDRLFFEAGRRAARPRAWPLTACAFAALSAVALSDRQPGCAIRRDVHVTVKTAAPFGTAPRIGRHSGAPGHAEVQAALAHGRSDDVLLLRVCDAGYS